MSVQGVLVLGAMRMLRLVICWQHGHNVEVPRGELGLTKSVTHVHGVCLCSGGATIEESQRGFVYTMVSRKQLS